MFESKEFIGLIPIPMPSRIKKIFIFKFPDVALEFSFISDFFKS